jgi:hypothetical protein
MVKLIFFANFQIHGPLGCQGWVAIPQNVEKIQNHCTLLSNLVTACHSVSAKEGGGGGVRNLHTQYTLKIYKAG